MKNPGKIDFVHCICTAGGDFTRYLQKFYFPQNMICAPDVKSGPGLKRPRARMNARVEALIQRFKDCSAHGHQIDFLYGHVPFLRDHREIFGFDYKHITVLRDPVKRFVSHFREHINRNNSLEKFMAWEKTYKSRDDDELDDHNDNGLSFNHQTDFISGFNNIVSNHDDLRQAKQNLGAFSFVGIAEEYDSSVRLFSKTFSCPYIYIPPLKKYKAKNIQVIAPSVLAYIREKSYLDVDLYDFGRNLFAEQMERHRNTELPIPSGFEKYFLYPARDASLMVAKIRAKIRNRLLGENVLY